MLVPAGVGGGEAEPAELVAAVSELARGDGSAGWCLAVAATSGMLAAYVPREAAQEVYGGEGSIAGGVFAPMGRAQPQGEEGASYNVTGRWRFGSCCQHCDWLRGGCLVSEGDGLRKLESGAPDIRFMLFPAAETEVIDTWNVAGLRGTGSHDFSVTEIVVPHERSASLITDDPRCEGPLYAFPVFGLLALSIASVGLGIARGAIDDLVELATAKKPTGSTRTLAQRSDTQAAVAAAEAQVRSARALIDDAVGEAWRAASDGGEISVELKAALRLAASHAIRSSRDAVDSMYELGGGSAIYESSPLQRRLRDIHVATQHMLVGPATWELAGRILLGQEADASQL
ncbi:acyl-CoA dehydrogenase family protein [soil metagenome]